MFILSNCLVLAAALFAIGVYGVLARRNMLIMLMSVELMLNAANLALAAFARYHFARGDHAGQVFVLFAIAVAAAEAAVGLAILLAFFRNRETADAGALDILKG